MYKSTFNVLFFFGLLLKSTYSLKYSLCNGVYFTFTSGAIYVTELVATSTVTLVGAVHVGALLTARIAVTLVQIYGETRRSHTITSSTYVHLSDRKNKSPSPRRDADAAPFMNSARVNENSLLSVG